MILNKYYTNLKEKVFFKAIKDDSRLVEKGDLFVAIKGKSYDGADFIQDAIKKGASFIISEHLINSFPSLKVLDSKAELIKLLNFYYPYHKNLNLIGITGTNGKTTTAVLLNDMLEKFDSSGYIGTNGIIFKKSNYKLKNTTPSNTILYKNLDSFYFRNIKNAVLEISSEGILDGRGMNFSYNAIIFTNISREHLNTHKTMKKYLNTKLELFKQLKKDGIAIINHDMKYKNKVMKKIKTKMISFGMNGGDYQAKKIISTVDGTLFDLYYKNHYLSQIETPLFGKYNVYNTLSVIAYLYEIGYPINKIKLELNDHLKLDGRFDYTKINHRHFIIDFAHTPHAIISVLIELKKLGFNHIITILGAQGGKDTGKRVYMGKYASIYSDTLILTSEDPKNESIFKIFSELNKKIKTDYYLTISRYDAIKLGISLMMPNDVLVIFGKGNENFEIIKNYKFNYNDKKTLIKLLNSQGFLS